MKRKTISIFLPKAITLIELLICTSLLGVLILGIHNIIAFSTYHHASADRLAKLQNDVARCLEHITKNAGRAIGNTTVGGFENTGTGILDVFIDTDDSGGGVGIRDTWIRYQQSGNSLNYYANCGGGATPSCAGSPDILANGTIIANGFTSLMGASNYLEISLTARSNPLMVVASDNPEVSMQCTVAMPEVSTN